VDGSSMLRLYLAGPENLRLHIWNSQLATADVSKKHTHPWNFQSYVVAGEMYNVRWTEGEGYPYRKQELICGQGGCLLGESQIVRLHPRPREKWFPGISYSQEADEIHSSHPEDGTVTIISRWVNPERSADKAYVYWSTGGNWVSAEPRDALPQEIRETTRLALERWF
jgi:hypothetical protein